MKWTREVVEVLHYFPSPNQKSRKWTNDDVKTRKYDVMMKLRMMTFTYDEMMM